MSMFPIASLTLSSAGSFTFSNIPQNFNHLQIRLYSRSNFASATASAFLRFNSDSGSNYTYHNLQSDGATATANSATGSTVAWAGNVPAANSLANVFGSTIIDILEYNTTNKNKIIRAIDGYDTNGAGQVYLASSLWLNTSAVSSILLVSGGGANFVAGSRADLYGISTSNLTGA